MTDIASRSDRLFDIHMLAGLDRPDRGEGVPVVGRGDGNRVDRLVVENPPQILFRVGRLALNPLDRPQLLLGIPLVAIADGDDVAVQLLVKEAVDVISTPPARTNDRDPHSVDRVGLRTRRRRARLGRGLRRKRRRGGKSRGDSGRIQEELSAITRTHDSDSGRVV
jgi:hypothetical protein